MHAQSEERRLQEISGKKVGQPLRVSSLSLKKIRLRFKVEPTHVKWTSKAEEESEAIQPWNSLSVFSFSYCLSSFRPYDDITVTGRQRDTRTEP